MFGAPWHPYVRFMNTEDWGLEATKAVTELGQAADAAGRSDLTRDLARLQGAVASAQTTVAVVGGYQQGKTSLVAALLGAAVAPTGPAGTTPAFVMVRHGSEVTMQAGGGPVLPCDLDEVALIAASVWNSTAGAPVPLAVTVPSPLLEEGLVLADTPGAPGFGGAAVNAAVAALPVADAVLLVTSATQPMTSSEIELAVAVERSGRPVLVVATRADLQYDWVPLRNANRDALSEAGAHPPVVAVSVPLRIAAMAAGDDELDAESGVDAVVDWLLDDVVASVDAHRRRRVTIEGKGVIASLRDQKDAELEVVDGSADSGATLESLERQALAVQQGASRWGQQLTDLMTDLRSYADKDLRDRALAVVEAAEKRIEDGDPAKGWDTFHGWIEEQVAEGMTAHLAWRHARLISAVEQSAAGFGELVALAVPDADLSPAAKAAKVARLSALPKKVSVGTSMYAVIRNSYGGLAMFGFFGGVAGIAISLPVTLGIGVVLGGKSYREERGKQMAQRRSAAKTAARSYVEATWGTFSTDARVQLRNLQRQVREELGAAVERLSQDTRAAYEGARVAATSDHTTRAKRRVELGQELAVLDDLDTRLDALAPAGAVPEAELEEARV